MASYFDNLSARRVRGSIVLLAAFALSNLCAAPCAAAQGLVYFDAIDYLAAGGPQNLFPAAGGDLSTVLDAVNSAQMGVPNNGLWNYRADGAPSGGFATIYESNTENNAELVQRVTGLTPNASYDVYVTYWSDQTEWGIRAGFTSNPGANPLFNRTGANGGTAGSVAGAGAWATPPLDNPDDDDTIDSPSPYVNGLTITSATALNSCIWGA